jgi:hypothetical protein
MVSSTQQFERIRKRKATTNGKRNKRERRALGTPHFPIHLAGYDSKAADAPRAAKPPQAVKAVKVAKAAKGPEAAKSDK